MKNEQESQNDMARNRRYQSAANRFGPALKAFLLCLLIGGSGVGYVWQKDQISQLGRQIKKRELRLDELKNQSEKLKKQLAAMRSPPYLERRIQELGLGLGPPQPTQVWRLAEPARDLSPPERERQYAAPRERTTEPKG
jgi:cell division protein FtsB